MILTQLFHRARALLEKREWKLFFDYEYEHEHDYECEPESIGSTGILRKGELLMLYFDHERLMVYQVSIEFVTWAGDLIESVPKKAAVKDQLDRASTSITLNIAEGNGKSSLPDRKRFFEISRGSAFECAACLDILSHANSLQRRQFEMAKSC